jgi:hypothetical protein
MHKLHLEDPCNHTSNGALRWWGFDLGAQEFKQVRCELLLYMPKLHLEDPWNNNSEWRVHCGLQWRFDPGHRSSDQDVCKLMLYIPKLHVDCLSVLV